MARICPHNIGDVVQRHDGVDPNELYPATAWERIDDVFLRCSGVDPAGTTGGSDTHTLDVSEMPAHAHTVPAHGHGLSGGITSSGSHTISGGGHTHTITTKLQNIRAKGDLAMPSHNSTAASSTTTSSTIGSDTGSHSHTVANHTHTHNLAVSDKAAFSTQNAGGGSAFSLLPKYVAVDTWKRVA